jgi:hypothetical protein
MAFVLVAVRRVVPGEPAEGAAGLKWTRFGDQRGSWNGPLGWRNGADDIETRGKRAARRFDELAMIAIFIEEVRNMSPPDHRAMKTVHAAARRRGRSAA